MTNFEKKTKSPETLAKFINYVINFAICHGQCFIPDGCDDTISCEECITKWLNKEARDEE